MAAEGVEDIFAGSTPTKKSIAELNLPQTEKPLHYTYLKEFRVEQCPLFLQHKCTQHRPFTCFYWHFLNQKRRRPKKKKDGEFSYSPDVYCQQYNETTGECIGGEECPYLHRVAGDVERRYHLRYYKTSPCVYETDPRGYCVKNGAHCAFAHGPHDLRQPVYDIRELKAMVEQGEGDDDKLIVPDDVRWNDTNYVLANYKTESCKKPPRLCRQGYACPQYHNNRDRRRSPRKYKYRSTPCPNVKHGDEWGDPAACENGDSCAYCHTRTEQQFHPEIYKSTKCNDMQQTGQCPRGPFCAFAHIENGVGATSPVSKSGSISIIPDKEIRQRRKDSVAVRGSLVGRDESGSLHSSVSGESPLPSPAHPRQFRSSSVSGPYARVVEGNLSHFESDNNNNNPYSCSLPTYEKAVGSGRRSSSRESDSQLFMDRHYSMSQSSTGSEPRTPSKGISASAAPFYPGASTVESVVGSALGDLNIDTAFDLDFEVDDLSISSSVGTGGLGTSSTSFMGQLRNGSEPVSIPGTQSLRHSSFTSQTSASPTSPGMAPSSSSFYSTSMSRHDLIKSPKSSIPRNVLESDMPISPKFQSPRLSSPLGFGSLGTNDTQRLTDEIINLRSKLSDWEESWQQAKLACDAWKREALELGNKAKAADREKMQWGLKLAETEFELRSARRELESQDGGPCLHLLQKEKLTDLESQSVAQLKALFLQLKGDLEKLEKIISRKESISCTVCVETPRCVVTYPCTHCVMCERCANKAAECPFCKVSIKQKTTIFIPV